MQNRSLIITRTLILPIIIGLLSFIILDKPVLSIINNKDFEQSIGSDKDEGGNSEITLLNSSSNLYSYHFKLGDKAKYPYVYFKVKKREHQNLDFSDYDKIKLNVSSSEPGFININFYRFIENYTDLNSFKTYFPYTYKLQVNNDSFNYIINIEDIDVPDWWIYENNYKESKIPSKILKDIIYFEIANSDETPLQTDIKVSIRDLSFIKNKTSSLIWAIFICVLYYISYSLVTIILKRVKSYRIIPLELVKKECKKGKIENYIYENYKDPLLSLTKIADDLNMSIRSISDYINRNYKTTFPGFINSIRVNEAKKLLSRTDAKILDIAIDIGYNSPGHFNRIFKKLEKCTPREFRNSKF